MKLDFKISLCVLVLQAFHSLPAFANKGVSGGNGIGGTLADTVVYEEGIELQPRDIESTIEAGLPETVSAFPTLRHIVKRLTISKEAKIWFLDSRALNPACLNPITIEANQKILACQNDAEVRINQDWWAAATDRDKAELILHEILTALKFRDGKFSGVAPLLAALTARPLKVSVVETRSYRLNFGYLAPKSVWLSVVGKTFEHLKSVCAAPDRKARQTLFESYRNSLGSEPSHQRDLLKYASLTIGLAFIRDESHCPATWEASADLVDTGWWIRNTLE